MTAGGEGWGGGSGEGWGLGGSFAVSAQVLLLKLPAVSLVPRSCTRAPKSGICAVEAID